MTNRRQLSWAFAWNIFCVVKERETSFWVILSKGASPGVCTVIWRLYTCVSSGNILHLPDWKKSDTTLYTSKVLWTSADRLFTHDITMNADCYVETLEHLSAIKIRRPVGYHMELLFFVTMPDCTLHWPHVRSCISFSGKIFHIPLQSRLVALWLSCVLGQCKRHVKVSTSQ